MPGFSDFISLTPLVLVAVYLVLPLFPLLYVILRWRTAGEGEPGLGLRAALLYFTSISVLVVTTGVAFLLHSLVSDDPNPEAVDRMRRSAYGLLLGGALFFAVNAMVVLRLPAARADDATTRVFRGFVLIMSGLVTLVALLILCVKLFEKGSNIDDLREPLVWTGVWMICYLAHLGILRPKSHREPFEHPEHHEHPE
jgi:hypothetical protein